MFLTIGPYVETRAAYAGKFIVWAWAEANWRLASFYLVTLQRAARFGRRTIWRFIAVKIQNLVWLGRNVSPTTS